MKTVFLFHRDFRLTDNIGLIAACQESEEVIPVFIFTPEQIEDNDYFSANSFQFLMESLFDLRKQLRKVGSDLRCFFGDTLEILEELLEAEDFDRVVWNRDFTPFAKERDQEILEWAQENGLEAADALDYTLLDLDTIRTQKGDPYQVFTYFYKNILKRLDEIPAVDDFQDWKMLAPPAKKPTANQLELEEIDYVQNPDIAIKGGRQEGLKTLGKDEVMSGYDEIRERADWNTTLLSAHIKFGTVSIREVYETFREYGDSLVRQLIWRDFYTNIVANFPKKRTLSGYTAGGEDDDTGNFRRMEIEWENDPERWEAWSTASTGFPFVDAGLRQMISTGWMHNQARMVVANFLTTIMRVDWHWGEKFFAQHLVDYDPAVNNGNWQWAAQVGVDRPRSYPRFYNPDKSGKDHDPDGEYIKTWVPELREVPVQDLHRWQKKWDEYEVDYPVPVVDFDEERKISKEFFQSAPKYS